MTVPRHKFAIVTDSASDLTLAQAEEFGVRVVPLSVTVGEDTFDDGAVSQAELFRLIKASDTPPATSQPSPGRLAQAYAQALETADRVIAPHVSSRISGTYDSALIAARDFPDRVHVFDSRNLSWGLGWQVIDAVHAAREGLGVTETLARLDHTRKRVKQVVSLDSLEGLYRSGRINAAASYVGSLLNLKVQVAVDPKGAFVPIRGNRSNKAAMNLVMNWVSKHMEGVQGGRFAVGHAMAPEMAERLAEEISQRWEIDELVMYEAGSAISTHAGVIWGTAFWPRG